MSQTQLGDLVTFLRQGQADIGAVIEDQGKRKGDVARGRTLYAAQCPSCHEAGGNKLDFQGGKEGIQGVGWLANDNPQESIHKIRGHPGSDMPSKLVDRGLSEQDAIDILTDSQSLDTK
jgi:mono/diheme cytochrome c family protein